MLINITREVTEQVNIPDKHAQEITIKWRETVVGHGYYLRKENEKIVVKEDDPYHRHGSISEEYVRDATEIDIHIFAVLKHLKDMKK